MTSTLIESQVKEFNYRVKGTDKSWNNDSGGEAIAPAVVARVA